MSRRRQAAQSAVAAVIPAAGLGRRYGASLPKAFVRLSGRPLLEHTLRRLRASYPFAETWVALHPKSKPVFERMMRRAGFRGVRTVPGGRTRAQSVKNAVMAVSAHCRWVLVHDAARPLVSRTMVRRTLHEARKTGAALCAEPVSATVKESDSSGARTVKTLDRSKIFLAQTPQVFRRDLLLRRYRELGNRALGATDEAALFDRTDVKVGLVPGHWTNFKITTRRDADLFRYFQSRREK